MAENNSRSVPWKWVAMVAVGIIIALLGAWGNDITNRATSAQAETSAQAARISALEASFQTILLRLDRIENKIDRQEGRR